MPKLRRDQLGATADDDSLRAAIFAEGMSAFAWLLGQAHELPSPAEVGALAQVLAREAERIALSIEIDGQAAARPRLPLSSFG